MKLIITLFALSILTFSVKAQQLSPMLQFDVHVWKSSRITDSLPTTLICSDSLFRTFYFPQLWTKCPLTIYPIGIQIFTPDLLEAKQKEIKIIIDGKTYYLLAKTAND